MASNFWQAYSHTVGKPGETALGTPLDAFRGAALKRLRRLVPSTIQQTQIVVVDWLADSHGTPVLGTIESRENILRILLNGSRKEDPADLLHTISEEVCHLIQYQRGDPVDTTLPYEQRPHEIEAKRFAERIVGYSAPKRGIQILRLGPPQPRQANDDIARLADDFARRIEFSRLLLHIDPVRYKPFQPTPR